MPTVRKIADEDFNVIESSGADSQRSSAEVLGAIDVVRRVANDGELFAREVELRVFLDALIRERGQIAAIVRLVTKGARQVKDSKNRYCHWAEASV